MSNSQLRRSIHMVAIIEAAKGTLVLIAGFVFFGLLHKDVHAISCELVSRLHLNPAHLYSKIFIDLASNINDSRLWLFAGIALLYSTFRFIEAYGLWKELIWAEWLALLSGAMYVPFECYEMYVKPSYPCLFLLLANLLVVGIIGLVFLQKRRDCLKSNELRESGKIEQIKLSCPEAAACEDFSN